MIWVLFLYNINFVSLRLFSGPNHWHGIILFLKYLNSRQTTITVRAAFEKSMAEAIESIIHEDQRAQINVAREHKTLGSWKLKLWRFKPTFSPPAHAWRQHPRRRTSRRQRCRAPPSPQLPETGSSSSDLEPTFRASRARKEPYSCYTRHDHSKAGGKTCDSGYKLIK